MAAEAQVGIGIGVRSNFMDVVTPEITDMYSLAYKFNEVFSVAYFDAPSYEDAILMVSRMRKMEGVGLVDKDAFQFINVLDRRLDMYRLHFGSMVVEVYAFDDKEAVERAHCVQMSTRPVIRINNSF